MSYQPCTGLKATIVRQKLATTLAAVCGHTCLIMTLIGMLGATPCSAAPGELLFKLVSPEPQPGADFGSTLAIVDGDILIGEPNRAVNNTAYVGQAYLFDGQSGELEHLLRILSRAVTMHSATHWRVAMEWCSCQPVDWTTRSMPLMLLQDNTCIG